MSDDTRMEVNEAQPDHDSVNVNEESDWYDDNSPDSFSEKELQNSADKVFCFETDHAALIGNADYHLLMRALAILQAQRVRVIQDIQKLQKMRSNVKDNPKEYLRRFLNGDTSDIPSEIKVKKVPEIDWSKYQLKSTNQVFTNSQSTDPQNSTPKGVGCKNIIIENDNSMTVRGRICDQSKPRSFNQLWSAEEQLRLEELLVQFPPETNENSRWRKIAQALGNRTTKQVCSRVQKYFKKLTKAGLPIPGHQLKTNTMTSLKKKPRRQIKGRERDSTFFPTQHLGANQVLECDDQKSPTPVVTQELKAEILEKVIEYKKKDALLSSFEHPDIQCTICEELPLQGTRWHCLVCQSVNLCGDCVISQLDTEVVTHSPLHPLEPLSSPSINHWDPDYLPDSFKTTNYLDPNFVSSNVL